MQPNAPNVLGNDGPLVLLKILFNCFVIVRVSDTRLILSGSVKQIFTPNIMVAFPKGYRLFLELTNNFYDLEMEKEGNDIAEIFG